MKRNFLALLLIIPLFSFAKNADSTNRWEAGVGIGISRNSVQSDWENHSFKHSMNFASQISIARNFGRHFHVGAEVCPTTIAYNGTAYLHMVNGTTVTIIPEHYKVVISNPVLPLCLFADYSVSIKDIKLYAGLAAGYAFTMINAGSNNKYYDKARGGITFGGQVGLQDKLTRHLSAYLEVDVRNLSLQENVVYYTYLPSPLYYYCGLVGLRYGF